MAANHQSFSLSVGEDNANFDPFPLCEGFIPALVLKSTYSTETSKHPTNQIIGSGR